MWLQISLVSAYLLWGPSCRWRASIHRNAKTFTYKCVKLKRWQQSQPFSPYTPIIVVLYFSKNSRVVTQIIFFIFQSIGRNGPPACVPLPYGFIHDRSATFASNLMCTTLLLDDCQLQKSGANVILSQGDSRIVELKMELFCEQTAFHSSLWLQLSKKLVSLDKSPGGVMYVVSLLHPHIFHHWRLHTNITALKQIFSVTDMQSHFWTLAFNTLTPDSRLDCLKNLMRSFLQLPISVPAWYLLLLLLHYRSQPYWQNYRTAIFYQSPRICVALSPIVMHKALLPDADSRAPAIIARRPDAGKAVKVDS